MDQNLFLIKITYKQIENKPEAQNLTNHEPLNHEINIREETKENSRRYRREGKNERNPETGNPRKYFWGKN